MVNLTGRIKQLTIFGELEFIDGNDYDVSLNSKIVIVSGVFKVVGTDETEQLQIEMETKEFWKHHKSL